MVKVFQTKAQDYTILIFGVGRDGLQDMIQIIVLRCVIFATYGNLKRKSKIGSWMFLREAVPAQVQAAANNR